MTKKKQLTITEMARLGGKARGKTLSKEQLSKIGKAGAAKRWGTKSKKGRD